MDGVLVVDKAPGLTSHDVVGRVRRALGLQRIGHTGTLDPLATGVLPLVIGRATRLASLLSGGTKQYDALVRLGLVTDTYDVTGQPVNPGPASAGPLIEIDRVRLDEARRAFMGTFAQQPPPFSAKKVGGVRAYRLARRQQAVAIRPREVTVSALQVEPAGPGRLRCRVECSPGFYVRALAHDLGQWLGCGACLEALRRERTGRFGLEGAVSLTTIEAEGRDAERRVVSLGTLLTDLPVLALSGRGVRRAAHGQILTTEDVAHLEPWPAEAGRPDSGRHPLVRLLDEAGTLVALAEWTAEGLLHPTIVLV